MAKMNIGIIHGFVGGGGGTEKTLYAIIEALSETKHNVTLYTFSKPKIPTNRITVKSSLPFSIPAFGLYQRAMESKLVLKAKNEDILIQASAGLSIPVRDEQKIIVYCHNDFKNELEKTNTKYKGVWAFYYKPYYNIIKKFFEKIHEQNILLISNSRFTQQSIIERFQKDSTIIFPPVDITEFRPMTKENSVATVSRFSKEKNLEFALDVMGKIDINYTLIGNTKTKSNVLYYDKLLSQINKRQLDSKINLLKNISHKELVSILNKAKVYFHTSPETFGISVVESMASGCIPIVPDNSAHKETVPFIELRYEPGNKEDAKEKIKKALSGKYDEFLKPLQDSLKKFSKSQFKEKIKQFIEKESQEK